MSLEYIYITRHGFRSNWVVDPATGDYRSNFPTPTGIAADPALTSHGVDQARELAAHLSRRDGDGRGYQPAPVAAPVERIYCSPYYRCLETVRPFVETVRDAETEGGLMESRSMLPAASYETRAAHERPWWAVRCDPGLVDWFGAAPFEQPQPAPVAVLRDRFFPWIDAAYTAAQEDSGAVPLRHGETMAQLHARMASALGHIIAQCDRDGVRAVLICSHAAPIIAMGRALTGDVPFDVAAEDIGTFTCGLSTFRRRRQGPRGQQRSVPKNLPGFDGADRSQTLPWDDEHQTLRREPWTGGRGVGGGWDLEVNCDCSFLTGGEERGCGDDEAFAAHSKGPMVDSGLELGTVVHGRSTERAQDGRQTRHQATQTRRVERTTQTTQTTQTETRAAREPRETYEARETQTEALVQDAAGLLADADPVDRETDRETDREPGREPDHAEPADVDASGDSGHTDSSHTDNGKRGARQASSQTQTHAEHGPRGPMPKL